MTCLGKRVVPARSFRPRSEHAASTEAVLPERGCPRSSRPIRVVLPDGLSGGRPWVTERDFARWAIRLCDGLRQVHVEIWVRYRTDPGFGRCLVTRVLSPA